MEEGKRKIEKKSDYCKNNPNFCMLPVLSFSQPSDHGVGSPDHIQKSVIFMIIHYLFHLHFHLYFFYLEKRDHGVGSSDHFVNF